MRMIKLIILIFALSGFECRYRILKETPNRENDAESLAETAVLSLLSCYENKVDTLGGIGIEDTTLLNILTTKQPLPVKLFGHEDEIRAAPLKINWLWGPHKLHLFVTKTYSGQRFEEFVQSFERVLLSQPSAHLATFLIIEWPSQSNKKGCSNASGYLWWLWTYSVIRAFYVCVDKLENRVLVYTFNPYTSRAPAPWSLNKTLNGYYGHPWSLFVRKYHSANQQICNNLDFVKTHDLGGHPIRCFLNTHSPFSQVTAKYAEKIYWSNFLDIVIARSAIKALNATADFYLIGTEGNNRVAGNFRENITEELFEKRCKVYWNFVDSLSWGKLRMSIPVMKYDYVVVTHHKGGMSQLDKLIGVFDRATRFGICLVIIATVLFFKFFMRQPLGTAAMNVVRIISNTGLLRVPNENAPRLYLAGVFILVVTIIGVYQGLLAALLTKPTPLPEINTFEDLADSLHKIYIPRPEFTKFFTDPRFNGRLVVRRGPICEPFGNKELLIRPLDACLVLRVIGIGYAIAQNLHISRETIVPAYAAYEISSNWDLEERFNEILASFTESPIKLQIYERDLQQKQEIAEYKDNLERDRPVVMILSNLGFAFAFLGIGLSLATIVLVIEIAMKRRQLARRNTRPVRPPRVDKRIKTQIPMAQLACVPGPSNLP